MPDYLQSIIDTVLWIFVIIGTVVLPVALFLYLVIAHTGAFFSPKGRINRLAFLEGLSAWTLFNAFNVMFIILYMMYSANFFSKTLGDTDYAIFAKFYQTLFFLEWVIAIWTLAAICAKRWQDLNFPGWLAVINTAPVFIVGWALLAFFGGLGPAIFYRIVTDPNAQGQGFNAFTIFAQAQTMYYNQSIAPNPLYPWFVASALGGVFLYLGIAEGLPGAKQSRKKSAASGVVRPGRA